MIKRILMTIVITFLLTTPAYASPLSSEDATLIVKTVWLEAGNQDLEGKRLVAAVILNRVESDAFPDTVEGVLSAPGQFATYHALSKSHPTIEDAIAVQMEINQRSNTEVMFFRTKRYGTGEPLMKVGDHYFSGIKEGSL